MRPDPEDDPLMDGVRDFLYVLAWIGLALLFAGSIDNISTWIGNLL
jgi:hypothetical protein